MNFKVHEYYLSFFLLCISPPLNILANIIFLLLCYLVTLVNTCQISMFHKHKMHPHNAKNRLFF